MKDSPRCFKELYLGIAPSRFHFLKFILEGYDGLTMLSSVNGKTGIVCLRYPVGSERTLFELLSSLAKKISKYT
ncbi:MAG: DUF4911 domain-containing protein [Desulfobulbaceae bacterium]|nr:DUF4911 domain-containing protein [Desulfobulbaceae bacterium]